MPISYVQIRRQIALRSAQLSGSAQASLETAYTETVFADGLDGAEVPASAIKDLILMIEKELAQTIGNNVTHPARSLLYGRSADLANLDSTPTVDNNGVEFVGQFDSAADSETGRPLTAQPTETLTDYENTFFSDTELFNFCVVGNTIQHTREEAFLQGCVWDYDIQSAAYDAAGDSPLPQAMANTWIAGCMASLPQVGWVDGAGVGGMYGNMYAQGLGLLQSGAMGQINLPLASQNSAAG